MNAVLDSLAGSMTLDGHASDSASYEENQGRLDASLYENVTLVSSSGKVKDFKLLIPM